MAFLQCFQFFYNFSQKFQKLHRKLRKISTKFSITMTYFLHIRLRFFKFFWEVHEISTEFFQNLSHISLKSFLKNFQKFFPIFLNVPKFYLHLHFFKLCPGFIESFLFCNISLKFYPNLSVFHFHYSYMFPQKFFKIFL